MAQLVERLPARHEVMDSNPGLSVTFFIAENIPVLSGRLVLHETFNAAFIEHDERQKPGKNHIRTNFIS